MAEDGRRFAMRRWLCTGAIIGLGMLAAWLLLHLLPHSEQLSMFPQSLQDQLRYPNSTVEASREEEGLLRLRALTQEPTEVVHAYYRQRFEGRDGWVTELMTPTQMRFHRSRGQFGPEPWFEDDVDIAIMAHRDGTRIFISYDSLAQCHSC